MRSNGIACTETFRCRKTHPPSSLIMSTPKSQAPLAMNDGEKIIDGDGSATQWAVLAITTTTEFAISISGEFYGCCDFA